jgi:hypothetical protein
VKKIQAKMMNGQNPDTAMAMAAYMDLARISAAAMSPTSTATSAAAATALKSASPSASSSSSSAATKPTPVARKPKVAVAKTGTMSAAMAAMRKTLSGSVGKPRRSLDPKMLTAAGKAAYLGGASAAKSVIFSIEIFVQFSQKKSLYIFFHRNISAL